MRALANGFLFVIGMALGILVLWVSLAVVVYHCGGIQ
jgi:hypothetical protein